MTGTDQQPNLLTRIWRSLWMWMQRQEEEEEQAIVQQQEHVDVEAEALLRDEERRHGPK